MPKVRKLDIVRGDLWPGDAFLIENTGVDLGALGVIAHIQVRDKPNGTIYIDQSPTPSYPTTDSMTFTISFTGADTAPLPGQVLVADVKLSAPGDTFGPFTILSYQFNVIKDITL